MRSWFWGFDLQDGPLLTGKRIELVPRWHGMNEAKKIVVDHNDRTEAVEGDGFWTTAIVSNDACFPGTSGAPEMNSVTVSF